MKPRFLWVLAALLALLVLRANVSPAFTPVRAELATAHGFARGVLNLVVLSRGEPFAHASAWSFVVCAAVFLVLVRLTAVAEASAVRKPDTTYSRRVSTFLRVVRIGAVGVLLAVAASPYVTQYRVVLAPRTFMLCVVLICLPGTFGAVSAMARRWPPVVIGAIAAAFFASAMLQTLATYDWNYSGFLHLSREVADRAPFLVERPELARSLVIYDVGYDGQFMYLMAFDPLLQRFKDRPQEYRKVVDTPPYRYGRIGFSLLTDIVAAGRPERYPATMMWLIVAAHFALATMLASTAARHGLSPLTALWYIGIPGLTSSLLSALPEALAAAGMVAGYICWKTRRPALAALSFGAALLVRETGIILIAALLLMSARGNWKRSALVFIAALLPVSVWRLFVATRLFSDFGWRGLFPSSGNLELPFVGLFDFWKSVAEGTSSAAVLPAILFPLILCAALTLAVWLFSVQRGGLELGALAYAILAVCLDYVNHLPSVERATFELFVCLLLLLLESKERPIWIRRTLTGFFVVLAGYTFFMAPDSGISRAALLLIR